MKINQYEVIVLGSEKLQTIIHNEHVTGTLVVLPKQSDKPLTLTMLAIAWIFVTKTSPEP